MSRGRYTKLQDDPYQKERAPSPKKPTPTAEDYVEGTFYRYFLRKKSDFDYTIEIDKKQYDTLEQKKNGINNNLYEGFKMRWRIRGRLHDEYEGGVRTYPGVYESNQRLTEKMKLRFPQIENVIRNFTEHAQIEGATGSESITSNVNDHFHYVYIDSMGNGHTSAHINPKNPNITHIHEIRNHVIMESQDGCHPNCFSLFGYQGIGPHTHEIQ